MIVPLDFPDWRVVAFNLAWIVGAAIILFFASLWVAVRREDGQKLGRPFSDRPTRRGLIFGAVLVVSGAGLAFSIGEPRPVLKTVFVDVGKYDLDPARLPAAGTEGPTALDALEMLVIDADARTTRYPDDGRFVIMLRNGVIGTPFYRFAPGAYELAFEGAGNEALGDSARLYVYRVSWRAGRLALADLLAEIRLTPDIRPYAVRFAVGTEAVGKIRIQFFNDAGDPRTVGRNAYVAGVRLTKTG